MITPRLDSASGNLINITELGKTANNLGKSARHLLNRQPYIISFAISAVIFVFRSIAIDPAIYHNMANSSINTTHTPRRAPYVSLSLPLLSPTLSQSRRVRGSRGTCPSLLLPPRQAIMCRFSKVWALAYRRDAAARSFNLTRNRITKTGRKAMCTTGIVSLMPHGQHGLHRMSIVRRLSCLPGPSPDPHIQHAP